MRNSSTVCVDANLIVRLLGPTISPGILQQWNRWHATSTRIVAPRLIRYEVTNSLYQMIRRKTIDKGIADVALEAMTLLPLTLHHEDILHQMAMDYAVRFNISAAYDAHYLALADQMECDLWTADKRLFNSVNHHLSWVRFLPD